MYLFLILFLILNFKIMERQVYIMRNNIVKISKKDIIDKISEDTCTPKEQVMIIYDALENVIVDNLSSVTDDSPIKIELIKGLHINGKFVSAKEKYDNFTGNKVKVGNNIKVNCTTTSTFKRNYLKNK